MTKIHQISWTPVANINLVWWNTGLNPPAKAATERSGEELQFVIDEIKRIHVTEPFQLFGICEISEENLVKILSSLAMPYLNYHFHPHINNKVIVDTAIIYDERYLKVSKSHAWIDTYGRFETIKVGDSITFSVNLIDEEITVITSHWPSQKTYEEEHPHRIEIAIGHRKRLDYLRKEYGDREPYIILMGDYNAEPYSSPMAKHLLATRDRGLAIRYPDMLYNPFCRHVGESAPHIPDSEVESVGGTCFSSGDKYRRWASFDQIIFSPPFLRSSSIVLHEEHTKILATPLLREAIVGNNCIDHFPVTSRIQLRTKT